MTLDGVPLLAGLDAAALAAVSQAAQVRDFSAGQHICEEGDPGDSLLIIEHGVGHVMVDGDGGRHRVAVLHAGDVIGEMSLLTGQPRSASVHAVVPTRTSVLSRDAFTEVLAHHPRALTNLIHILVGRLRQTTATGITRGRHGEAVGLVVGAGCEAIAEALVRATAAASPGPVDVLGQRPAGTGANGVAGTLAVLEERLTSHRVVVLWCAQDEAVTFGLPHVDRTLVLARGHDAERLMARADAAAAVPPQLAVVGPASDQTTALRVVDGIGDAATIAWLGRHLARTKVGLALGAGGAKGYAHVGALEVLQGLGCPVDAVAGSSIGAVVGALIAMGKGAGEIGRRLREVFTAEAVRSLFTLSLAGTSADANAMDRVIGTLVGDKTFADLPIPLVVMAVDLRTRARRPIRQGRIRDALVAATALAGLMPPVEADGQLLVDALPLAPVPVTDLPPQDVDVRIAINLLSHATLPAWPGGSPPTPEAAGRPRLLQTLLEVMDMAQTDLSERQAAEAEVTITPTFGPGTWRDFHLADQYQAAGRDAAAGSTAAIGAHLTTTPAPEHQPHEGA